MVVCDAKMSLIERRAVEAELLMRVYDNARLSQGADVALDILKRVVDQAAFEAGQAFAAEAPSGTPSIAHFATVVDRWRAGGVLDIEDISATQVGLSFSVVRCGYMQMYTDMGIPPQFHSVLSCRRDAAFAEGYSSFLRLERPLVIGQGGKTCEFRFFWSTPSTW